MNRVQMKNRKIEKIMFIFFIIVFLQVLSRLLLSSEAGLFSSNYYNVLQIGRDASVTEIKKSYRKLSLEKHPDKNPNNPLASEQFIELQTAYKVLEDSVTRELYDKFGQSASEIAEKGEKGLEMASYVVLANYFGLFVLTFIITMSSSHTNAWCWSLLGLLMLGSIEYQLKFESKAYNLSMMLNTFTVFQLCELLKLIYPLYAHLVNLVQIESYIDNDEILLNTLQLLFLKMQTSYQAIEALKNELGIVKQAKLGTQSNKSAGDNISATKRPKSHKRG